MEEMQAILTAVSSVGFPIVAYFVNVFYTKKSMEELSQTIANNTETIARLTERMGGK